MHKTLLTLAMLQLISSVAVAQESTVPTPTEELPTDLRKKVRRAESTLGVEFKIHLDDPLSTPNRRIQTGPVDYSLASRALPRVVRHLSFYPKAVRTELVSEIHLIGKLRMRGKPFLGVARPKTGRFDLAIRPRTTARKLAHTFHHEFAHLIEGRPEFDRAAWEAISGKEAYAGTTHRTAYPGQSYLRAGFVNPYAARDSHEDFAELLELAISDPAQVNRLAERHDKIGQKLDILQETYASLHPRMPIPGETPLLGREAMKAHRKAKRIERRERRQERRRQSRAG